MPASISRKQSADLTTSTSIVKTVDNKGRISLGSTFANKHVIVESVSETEVVVKLARVIPENEAWLYENPEALTAVRAGLRQAHNRELVSDPPDLEADLELIAKLEDQ